MVEVDTDSLTPEQKAEVGAVEKDKPMSPNKLPEPFRSIMLLVLAGAGMFGGGAAGQSLFGVSEEKLNQKFAEQDRNIDSKFEVLKAQDAGKDLILQQHGDDIREFQTLLRDVDKRLTKVEAGK